MTSDYVHQTTWFESSILYYLNENHPQTSSTDGSKITNNFCPQYHTQSEKLCPLFEDYNKTLLKYNFLIYTIQTIIYYNSISAKKAYKLTIYHTFCQWHSFTCQKKLISIQNPPQSYVCTPLEHQDCCVAQFQLLHQSLWGVCQGIIYMYITLHTYKINHKHFLNSRDFREIISPTVHWPRKDWKVTFLLYSQKCLLQIWFPLHRKRFHPLNET